MDEVNEFYRVNGARGVAGPHDRIFVARSAGAIIGAVRLCEEEGHLVLRTMRVAASHQRRGVGLGLLRDLVATLGTRSCYLLGYAHLDGFYGREGFRVIEANELPPHLQERLKVYLGERSDYVAMRRTASASPAT